MPGDDLLVKISADIADLKKGMKQARDHVSSFDKTMKQLAVGAAAVYAGQKLIGFLQDSSKAAAEAEEVSNKLARALQLQGDNSAETRGKILEFSRALQAQTTAGDEAITNVQTTLIQLGRLSGEGLQTATRATLDLAAGLGIDLQAAALLVGKAAAGSTSSFSRYGLVVKNTGDKAKDFEAILAQINSRFGGQAAAAAQGMGKVKQLKEVFGDLEEVIGQRLNPALETAAARWTKWISAFNEWAEKQGASSDEMNLAEQDVKSLNSAIEHLTADAEAGTTKGLYKYGLAARNGLTQLTAAEADLIEKETMGAVVLDNANQSLAERIALINEAIRRNESYSNAQKLANVENAYKNPPPKPVDPDAAAAADKAAKEASERRVAQADYEADQLFAAWEREADALEKRNKAAADAEFEKLFRLPIEGADALQIKLAETELALSDLRSEMELTREQDGAVSPEQLQSVEDYKAQIIKLRAEIKAAAVEKKKIDEEQRESMQQMQEIYSAVGNAAANALGDVITNSEDAGEAAEQALRAVARQLIQIAIARIIANAGVAGSNVAARDTATSGVAGVVTGLAAAAAIAALAGKIPALHEGGRIGGPPGRDPSIVRVERGERVLSREQNAAYESGAVGGGSPVVIHFNSVLPPDEAGMRVAVRDHILPAIASLKRQRMA